MAIPADLKRLYAAHFINYGSIDTGVNSTIYGSSAKFRIVIDAERRDFKAGGIKIGNEAEYARDSHSWGFIASSIYARGSAFGTSLMTEITINSTTDATLGLPCTLNFEHRLVSFRLIDGTSGDGTYELLFKEYNGDFGIYYNNEKIGDIDNNGTVVTITSMPFSGPYRCIVKYGEDSLRVTNSRGYGGQNITSSATQIIEIPLNYRSYQIYSVDLIESTNLYNKYKYSFTQSYRNSHPENFGNQTIDYEIYDYKKLSSLRQIYSVYNTYSPLYIDSSIPTGYYEWISLNVSDQYRITNYVYNDQTRLFTVTFSNGSQVSWNRSAVYDDDISAHPLFKYNGRWHRMGQTDYPTYNSTPNLNTTNKWAINTVTLKYPYDYQFDLNMTNGSVTYKIGNLNNPIATETIPACPKLFYPGGYLEKPETILLGQFGYTSRVESTYAYNTSISYIDGTPSGFASSGYSPSANPTSSVLGGSIYPLKTSDPIKRVRIYYQPEGQQEELIRDLVPVINTTTNVISMYDLANDQLYSVGTRKPFSTAGYVGTLVADYPYIKNNCNSYKIKKGDTLVSSKKMFVKNTNGNLVPVYNVKLI